MKWALAFAFCWVGSLELGEHPLQKVVARSRGMVFCWESWVGRGWAELSVLTMGSMQGKSWVVSGVGPELCGKLFLSPWCPAPAA